jgi:S-adenosylmethionine synthetase
MLPKARLVARPRTQVLRRTDHHGTMAFVLESLLASSADSPTEIVERKGLGHPDTLCDAIAERFSRRLCEFYLERFGTILHHNVDKVLLRGGVSRAAFGHGEILEPIDLYLAGRAVGSVGGVTVPVEEIAVVHTRALLREQLHALDPERHVRIHCLVRPGSADLSSLFERGREAGVPLSNDTSIGVGYAPLSSLERSTLELESRLNARDFVRAHPAQGEDVKVMSVRRGNDVSVTVARAVIAAHTPSLHAYREETHRVATLARDVMARGGGDTTVHVNAADAPDGSSVYLTATGTSAEGGDDGEVGRGNRGNGLICPGRPMSLEALAGKNPVSHVGKLYDVVARDVAEAVLRHVPAVSYAECRLVSRIGAPIDDPALLQVRIVSSSPLDGRETADVEAVARETVARMRTASSRIVAGEVRLF